MEVLSPGCRTSQLLIDDWSSGEVFKSDKTLMLGFYQELITSLNSMYSNGKADIKTRIKYLNLYIYILIEMRKKDIEKIVGASSARMEKMPQLGLEPRSSSSRG